MNLNKNTSKGTKIEINQKLYVATFPNDFSTEIIQFKHWFLQWCTKQNCFTFKKNQSTKQNCSLWRMLLHQNKLPRTVSCKRCSDSCCKRVRRFSKRVNRFEWEPLDYFFSQFKMVSIKGDSVCLLWTEIWLKNSPVKISKILLDWHPFFLKCLYIFGRSYG